MEALRFSGEKKNKATSAKKQRDFLAKCRHVWQSVAISWQSILIFYQSIAIF
jgi:hypothetical protein